MRNQIRKLNLDSMYYVLATGIKYGYKYEWNVISTSEIQKKFI